MNNILVFIVCLALVLSLLVGIYALFKSQSSKRNYFLLMQAAIIVYLIGYLLELTSASADEAFTAVKVLYIGGFFVAPLAFFFVADYCNIKLRPLFVRMPMLLLSMASILAMWTTNFHRMVYVEYSFDAVVSNHLAFVPGPLYFVTRIFPIICMIMTFTVMIFRLISWKNKHRKMLFVFVWCALIPSVAEVIYLISIITGLNVQHINFTPHSLAVMSFFLYIGVVRYNIFDIICTATLSAMEHIKEGFVLVDDENNYMSSNSAAADMFPDIVNLPKGGSISTLRDWPEAMGKTEDGSVDFSMTCKEGIRHFRASISPVSSQSRAIIARIIIFSDITDSVILMKKLENAACFDCLTGLYNRKHFSELANVDIKRMLRLNRAIYIGMLDLDFFKSVNDTFGHAAGDMILKATAGIIRQTIRSYDLVGRYGGEEFAFLITDMEPREVLMLVERIRKNMDNHVAIYEGVKIKITCSIGLAKFLEDDTLESSLKKADAALYAAKNAGRNQVKICEELESVYNVDTL